MLTAVAANEPPTGSRMKDYQVMDLARRGALLNVKDRYAKDKKEMMADDYFDGLVKAYEYKGGLYGLPWHVYFYLTYYNKTLLGSAGISGPPDTWEQVIEYGKKVTNKEKNIYGTQMMSYAGNDAFMGKIAEMWARQQSASPKTDPWNLDSDPPRFNLTSDSMKASTQLWLDMMFKHQMALPPEMSKLANRIENNLIAVWFDSPIGASGLRGRGKVDFDLAVLPKAKNRATVVEQNGWAIFGNTGNDRMAWELAKWATGPEMDYEWSTDGVYLPKRKTDWTKEPFATHKDYKVARSMLEHPDAIFHTVYTNDWFRVMMDFASVMEEIYFQKKTLDQGLMDAQKKVEATLKELGYK
jgi:ABC-type glycerol-3-phosphate transport system substrate-binding protein